jgi:hypothetical protein
MKPSSRIGRVGTCLSLLVGVLAMLAVPLWPAVAPRGVAAADHPAGLGLASSGAALAVTLRFNPSSPSVATNDVFAVNVEVVAGSQPVDGAEIHVDFNPVYLQVVDAGGNPVTEIEPGTALDVALLNNVNNAQGQIDYAAGKLTGTPPSGTFVLATIRFKALAGTGGGSTPLTFVSRGGSPTNVTYAGDSVLTGVENGGVVISGGTPAITGTVTSTPTLTYTPTSTATGAATPTIPPTTPQIIIFQQGVSPSSSYAGVDDTYLSLLEPDRVNGQEGIMRMHSDGRYRPLLRFDMSEYIPYGSPIVQATLYLWLNYALPNSTYIDSELFLVRQAWEEETATWNTPWNGPGCSAVPADREETSRAADRIRQPPQWVSWDVTDLVQQWVSGASPNEGMLLLPSPGQPSRNMQFRSSDFTDGDQRPKLVVEYQRLPPTATPTASPTATRTSTPGPTSTATPLPGRIEGLVWDDVNGNQLSDAAEPRLAGATVSLYQDGQWELGTPIRPPVVTGLDGIFHFDGLPPGDYVLVETNPPGYISTTLDVISVVVISGLTSPARFGDQRISALLPIVIRQGS